METVRSTEKQGFDKALAIIAVAMDRHLEAIKRRATRPWEGQLTCAWCFSPFVSHATYVADYVRHAFADIVVHNGRVNFYCSRVCSDKALRSIETGK